MTEMRFPLLKLPYLCIEAVVLNLSCFDIVIFSHTSKKAYRLVKSFKSPVTSIRLFLNEDTILNLRPTDEQWESNRHDGDLFENIDYYTILFRCSVDILQIDGDYLPERNMNFSFSRLKQLVIRGKKEIDNQRLKYLIEHFEVIDLLILDIPVSNKFYCDPKIFKTKVLEVLGPNSAGWITGDFLSQLDSIHRLLFNRPQFTIKDVVSVIAEWFCGRKPSLKSLNIVFNVNIEPTDLAHKSFEPILYDPKRRPKGIINARGEEMDFTDGLDIVRSGGQLATIFVVENSLIFHIWSEDELRGLPCQMN